MKKLTLILTLLVSTVMFSSPSFAKWTKVGSSVKSGYTFYLDIKRTRKVDGFVYYWVLVDYLKPTKYGILSGKKYNQGDCRLFRSKSLSSVVHKQSMGRGWWRTSPQIKPKWVYPSPDSIMETILKSVCSRWVLNNEKTNSLNPNLSDIPHT